MPTQIRMPILSETMEEGKIVKWFFQEGDAVRAGEVLFSVESDKAVVEIEASVDGVLAHIATPTGAVVSVGSVVATIRGPSETLESSISAVPSQAPIRATPIAKKRAAEGGLDLAQVQGTGPGGRIILDDVERALAAGEQYVASEMRARGDRSSLATADVQEAAPPQEVPVYDVQPLTKTRQITAKRMSESKRSAPHFYLSVSVDASEIERLIAERTQPDQPTVSFTAVLIKAVGQTLVHHPLLRATYQEDGLRVYRDIHVGVATGTHNGLLVPVIRHADRLSLGDIGAALQELRKKAASGSFAADELSGGVFTVSNLGMFGVDRFQAIINPPESAILAVGRATLRPAVVGNEIVPQLQADLTLSVDHRALDGLTGARFLNDLREVLEHPYRLL